MTKASFVRAKLLRLCRRQIREMISDLHGWREKRCRSGFSLIELMIVIAIIGVLISLLIPAVQAARESARQTQCQNNLKQLGSGCLHHESAMKHFPYGGWNCYFLGNPDRGAGLKQPGGWIFNILPYIEQQSLYQLQSGKTGTALQTAAVQMIQTPLAALMCPSRRPAKLYPQAMDPGNAAAFEPPRAQEFLYDCSAAGPVVASGYTSVARNDYAGNGYDALGMSDLLTDAQVGAAMRTFLTQGVYGIDTNVFNNPTFVQAILTHLTQQTGGQGGVFYPCSELTADQINDGLSNTYLCGEKYMNPQHYNDGTGVYGNRWNAYVGCDADIIRYSSAPQYSAVACDNADFSDGHIWGSAHAGGFNMCFCDGSVRMIEYGINSTVHDRLGNRNDGQSVDVSSL
jgi:prepilin-type N-terminal cleavage/methylation domain-containing protein/prepilin-type processing-associated H-X9-DG protein